MYTACICHDKQEIKKKKLKINKTNGDVKYVYVNHFIVVRRRSE